MSRRGPGSPVSSILYVGSLPYEWSEDNARSVFCGSGNIVDVRMGFDYAGKNKGYCFIEYQTPQEALQAQALLSQVKIFNQPGAKMQYKKLRIEVSKEGLRANNGPTEKPILQLDRSFLPPNVQLPPELLARGPQPGVAMPPQPQGMPVGANNAFNGAYNSPSMANPVPVGPQVIAPVLPQPSVLPFKAPDKINETLSQLPPAQLMELIANLKNILSGANAARATEVFALSPNLATAAAQALLLMGFIDSDVIQDAMKNPYQPSPAPGHPQTMQKQQPNLPPPPHQFQNRRNGPQGMSNGPQLPTVPQMSNAPPSLPPNPKMNNYHAPTPPALASKWPQLPASTQAKLAAMDPGQADLIAQVLLLPPEQIQNLDPGKQTMVTNLRQQYL